MSMAPAAFDFPILSRDDEEGLFSRDFDGQLVRLDAPTEADYAREVTVQIDGKPVTVPLAEPLKDAQGNMVLDIAGRTTPRFTTIYDAAARLCESAGPSASMPIPILCHQPHMRPVAVCRLCVVQIYGVKRGKRSAERKLLPACQHQVKDGMEVFTMRDPGPDGDRVRRVVGVLTELMTADHLKPAPAPAPAAELAPFNELQLAADRFTPNGSRFTLDVVNGLGADVPARSVRKLAVDASSPVFIVDHSACILCDRCARACDEVKGNHIIGRTGKGASTSIGFDLDRKMGESGCVQCAECMVSCPTSAIAFKSTIGCIEPVEGTRPLTAKEMLSERLLAGVPGKFLLWQEGLARSRTVKRGDLLCRQGEPGNTAFLIKRGQYRIDIDQSPKPAAVLTNLVQLLVRGKKPPVVPPSATAPVFRGRKDVIVGEMSCLSGQPRTADVVALTDGEVWEIRRNVLDRAMRAPKARRIFQRLYRKRSLDLVLRWSDLLRESKELSDVPPKTQARCIEFLRKRVAFVEAKQGTQIFRQGETADCLYLVRLGHVQVVVKEKGREDKVFVRGPNSMIGEMGLLAITADDVYNEKLGGSVDARAKEYSARLGKSLKMVRADELSGALPAGQRNAICSALDPVEMARISRQDFLLMVRKFPTVRRRLVLVAFRRLADGASIDPLQQQFNEHRLYQAQNLLALDLDKCTRCDECVKACVGQHGEYSHGAPVTRLKRDGIKFGNFLVASSCRSCRDAYCMVGCPVDSIHRGPHGQIVIEDHCIGCGLCSSNCPFGNIWMVGNVNNQKPVPDPKRPGEVMMKAMPKAATCDQCDAAGKHDKPVYRCVSSCPHDAAHRMTGQELLKEVKKSWGMGV